MSIRLGQITDIKFDFFCLHTSFYSEVKPKNVASCVGINPQKEVILIITHFDCTIQISSLKSRLKDEFFLQIECWVHSLESAVEDLVFVELIVQHGLHNQRLTFTILLFLLILR